jgi:DNA-binding response OmpR family regulator
MTQLEEERPKVLLAEDQPAWRDLLARALRDAGYDVVEMGNGTTLREELKRGLLDEDNPREPDLVVSDLRMPGDSGLEVLRRLRRDDCMTPFILMTAFGDFDTHLAAARLGAARVFDKPFMPAELVRLVRELLPLAQPA